MYTTMRLLNNKYDMSRLKRLSIAVFFVYSIMTNSEGSVLTQTEEELVDNFVESMMQCRKIPGLGLAIVKGDEVLTKGYGFADLRTRRVFDDSTVSNIASAGKAMTVALLAVLMTEDKQAGGKLDWDTKLTEILGPNFKLPGDFRTDDLTFIDILSHRTGLRAVDYLMTAGFPNANTSKKELSGRLKYLPIVAPFRDKYIYNNIMYLFAGYVAEVLGGKPFKELLTEKIFRPLGMDSITYMDNMFENDKIALPYQLINGSLVDSDESIYKLREFTPAGAICLSAKDNAKWLKFILAKGKTIDGTQLIDKKIFSKIFKPHVAATSRSMNMYKPLPVSQVVAYYGLGWYGASYRGHRKMYHGGNWFGYSSKAAVYPDDDIGIFITVNGPWPITGSVTYHQFAHFLSDILLNETRWLNSSTICTYPEPWLRPREPKEPTVLPSFRKLPFLDHYSGNYGNPLYGDMQVTIQNEQLFLSVGYLMEGVLRPLEDDDEFFILDIQTPLSTAFPVLPTIVFLDKKENEYDKVVLEYKSWGETYDFYRNVKFSDNSLKGNVVSGGATFYAGSNIFILAILIVAYKTLT